LPDSAELHQLISEHLHWFQAHPDFFSDAQFRERHRNGAIEALRHVGADWLIGAITTTQSMIGRVRRLFRIAWPPAIGDSKSLPPWQCSTGLLRSLLRDNTRKLAAS
jgi:hypothetical protein